MAYRKLHPLLVGMLLCSLALVLTGAPPRQRASAQPDSPAVPLDDETNGIGEAVVVTGLTLDDPTAPCEEFGATLEALTYVYDGTPHILETIVRAGQEVYMAERLPLDSAGDTPVPLYAAQDLPLSYADFPLPTNTPLTATLTLYQGISETAMYQTQVHFVCNDEGSLTIQRAAPVLPNVPVARILGINGVGCQPGDISLDVFTSLELGKSYLLNTSIYNPNEELVLESQETIPGETGLRIVPLGDPQHDDELPDDINLTVLLTLQSATGQALFQSSILIFCATGFDNYDTSTPIQPAVPAVVLVDNTVQGCSQPVFELNLIKDLNQVYRFEILVTANGSVVYERTDTELNPPGFLPVEEPGITYWTIPVDSLPELTQVQFGLYTPTGTPLYLTRFDYTCSTGELANITATHPWIYLPSVDRP